MIKRILAISAIMLVIGYTGNAFATINVKFQVDMGVQMLLGNFNPSTDTLVVRGDFQIMAGDTSNWIGRVFKLSPSAANDSIYEITVAFPDTAVNQIIHYKYVMIHNNIDTWENDPNREYTITSDPNQTIPLVYFSNIPYPNITVNITFQADMTQLLDEGFVPGSDSIEVVGDTPPLTWTPPGAVLAQDLINPNIYYVTLSFTGNPGSTIQWKFHCDPANHFTNGGWESGDNRILTFPNADTTVGPLVPSIDYSVPTNGDNTVYFRVNMNGAHERFHGTLITGLTSVWIGGSAVPLQWPANWIFSDTGNTLIRMYDDGTHSDSIAGDKIYSRMLVFPAGDPSYVAFKYGAVFDGVDTLNGGWGYLDNEAGFSINHTLELIPTGGTVYRYNHFGDQVIPVELTLFTAAYSQNKVFLNWTTASETNNRGFEIERIQNSKVKSQKWDGIGFVEGFGTTTEFKNYSFIDKNVSPGNYLYRLKQIDFNGTYSYSKEISVNVNSLMLFGLEQNYPNPFNPTTTLKYSIANKQLTTLKVYDMLGKEVATLINEVKTPGEYEVKFDGSKLASGIYFYRLQAGDFVKVKKMILLK